MAEPIQIQGSDTEAKLRNPLGVVGLTIVTIGIYGIFWYYFVNKEMAKFGAARDTDDLGDSPGTSVLAITLGALIIVPAFVSVYHSWQRLNAGERLTRPIGHGIWPWPPAVDLHLADCPVHLSVQLEQGATGASRRRRGLTAGAASAAAGAVSQPRAGSGLPPSGYEQRRRASSRLLLSILATCGGFRWRPLSDQPRNPRVAP